MEKPWRRFISWKLRKYSQIPQPSPRVASTSNRTKDNHHWINHLQHSTWNKYVTLLAKRLRETHKPLSNTRNSWTHLRSASLWLKQGKKNKTLAITYSGPFILKILTCHVENLDLSWWKFRPIMMKISKYHDENFDLSWSKSWPIMIKVSN